MTRTVPATVAVPTIGRERLLTECLLSLASTDPQPADLLIVDQGGAGSARRLVRDLGIDARVIEPRAPGISRALNIAARDAAHDLLLVTHDDCRVEPDWVGVGYGLLADRPDVLFTGRVLPESSHDAVPSTITRLDPREYRAEARCNVLYPNNMALSARSALSLGGFDERFTVAAEDNDFCYRWLTSGRTSATSPGWWSGTGTGVLPRSSAGSTGGIGRPRARCTQSTCPDETSASCRPSSPTSGPAPSVPLAGDSGVIAMS